MTIKALIFDMDGVITDTAERHYRSWKRLADEEGLPFTRADNEALRGVTRRESLRRLLKGKAIDEDTAQAWMTRKNAYFHQLLEDMTPADRLPGLTRLLDEAQERGIKTGVASASRNVYPVLTRLDLVDRFHAIGDATTVENPKPAPDVFLWVADQLGVTPAETIVFEDSEDGVNAALAEGFNVVGLGTAPVHRAHLVLPDLADAHLDDLANRLNIAV